MTECCVCLEELEPSAVALRCSSGEHTVCEPCATHIIDTQLSMTGARPTVNDTAPYEVAIVCPGRVVGCSHRCFLRTSDFFGSPKPAVIVHFHQAHLRIATAQAIRLAQPAVAAAVSVPLVDSNSPSPPPPPMGIHESFVSRWADVLLLQCSSESERKDLGGLWRWVHDSCLAAFHEARYFRSPCCDNIFIDYEGCDALTCEACGASFCGVCLRRTGLDAHQHVRTFHANYFTKQELIKERRTLLKAEQLTAFLSNHAQHPILILMLVALAQKELAEVGVAVEHLIAHQRIRRYQFRAVGSRLTPEQHCRLTWDAMQQWLLVRHPADTQAAQRILLYDDGDSENNKNNKNNAASWHTLCSALFCVTQVHAGALPVLDSVAFSAYTDADLGWSEARRWLCMLADLCLVATHRNGIDLQGIVPLETIRQIVQFCTSYINSSEEDRDVVYLRIESVVQPMRRIFDLLHMWHTEYTGEMLIPATKYDVAHALVPLFFPSRIFDLYVHPNLLSRSEADWRDVSLLLKKDLDMLVTCIGPTVELAAAAATDSRRGALHTLLTARTLSPKQIGHALLQISRYIMLALVNSPHSSSSSSSSSPLQSDASFQNGLRWFATITRPNHYEDGNEHDGLGRMVSPDLMELASSPVFAKMTQASLVWTTDGVHMQKHTTKVILAMCRFLHWQILCAPVVVFADILAHTARWASLFQLLLTRAFQFEPQAPMHKNGNGDEAMDWIDIYLSSHPSESSSSSTSPHLLLVAAALLLVDMVDATSSIGDDNKEPPVVVCMLIRHIESCVPGGVLGFVHAVMRSVARSRDVMRIMVRLHSAFGHRWPDALDPRTIVSLFRACLGVASNNKCTLSVEAFHAITNTGPHWQIERLEEHAALFPLHVQERWWQWLGEAVAPSSSSPPSTRDLKALAFVTANLVDLVPAEAWSSSSSSSSSLLRGIIRSAWIFATIRPLEHAVQQSMVLLLGSVVSKTTLVVDTAAWESVLMHQWWCGETSAVRTDQLTSDGAVWLRLTLQLTGTNFLAIVSAKESPLLLLRIFEALWLRELERGRQSFEHIFINLQHLTKAMCYIWKLESNAPSSSSSSPTCFHVQLLRLALTLFSRSCALVSMYPDNAHAHKFCAAWIELLVLVHQSNQLLQLESGNWVDVIRLGTESAYPLVQLFTATEPAVLLPALSDTAVVVEATDQWIRAISSPGVPHPSTPTWTEIVFLLWRTHWTQPDVRQLVQSRLTPHSANIIQNIFAHTKASVDDGCTPGIVGWHLCDLLHNVPIERIFGPSTAATFVSECMQLLDFACRNPNVVHKELRAILRACQSRIDYDDGPHALKDALLSLATAQHARNCFELVARVSMDDFAALLQILLAFRASSSEGAYATSDGLMVMMTQYGVQQFWTHATVCDRVLSFLEQHIEHHSARDNKLFFRCLTSGLDILLSADDNNNTPRRQQQHQRARVIFNRMLTLIGCSSASLQYAATTTSRKRVRAE